MLPAEVSRDVETEGDALSASDSAADAAESPELSESDGVSADTGAGVQESGAEADGGGTRERSSGASASVAQEPVDPASGFGPGVAASAAMAVPSGSVGDMLMSARADSGFSKAEVTERTRIPRDILESLECGDVSSLPTEYYVTSHIERLCALYNVDAEPILKILRGKMADSRKDAKAPDHFAITGLGSESGAMIRPMPGGIAGKGPKDRGFSLTSLLVSAGIIIFMIAALGALVALHVRNRGKEAPGNEENAEMPPHIELKEFIVPKQLDAYELPIPE